MFRFKTYTDGGLPLVSAFVQLLYWLGQPGNKSLLNRSIPDTFNLGMKAKLLPFDHSV